MESVFLKTQCFRRISSLLLLFSYVKFVHKCFITFMCNFHEVIHVVRCHWLLKNKLDSSFALSFGFGSVSFGAPASKFTPQRQISRPGAKVRAPAPKWASSSRPSAVARAPAPLFRAPAPEKCPS